MLHLLLRYLPEEEAPRNRALAIVALGSLLAVLFGEVTEPFVHDAVRIAPFTPAILAAAIFAGRSAGFASLLINTALASAVLGYRDPALTFGTFLFQLVFGAAAFFAGDALRVAGRQLAARQAELMERERTLATLVEELDHRFKNMLAVVQLVARQTAANSSDLQTFEPAFQSRLSALARAQSSMIKARWGDVLLGEIIGGALEPFMSKEAEDGLRVTGGEALRVDGGCALGLALTLHELATNAGKYGALSCPGGRVEVRWSRNGEGMAVLIWQERGGPVVEPPSRRGFGGRLVRRMLEPYGEPDFDFAPAGLTFRYVFEPSA